jgi:hypothetical protein
VLRPRRPSLFRDCVLDTDHCVDALQHDGVFLLAVDERERCKVQRIDRWHVRNDAGNDEAKEAITDTSLNPVSSRGLRCCFTPFTLLPELPLLFENR